MLFLKALPANRLAYGNFLWPDQVGAIVEAPDWSPHPSCGYGLHGLRNGEGDLGLLCQHPDAVWYAFESVDENGNPSDAESVVIDYGKAKCHRAIIRAVGTRDEATAWLVEHGCTKVPYANHLVCDYQLATVGNYGTATSGNQGIAIGKDRATAKVAEGGTAITGSWGESEGCGHRAIAITDYQGTATVEDRSIAIADDHGTATAQECSIAIAGDAGTANVGMESIAIVRRGGTATSGAIGISIGAGTSGATTGNGGLAATSTYGVSLAGDDGIATTGYSGKATSGDRGTSITGPAGVAKVGKNGVAIADGSGRVSGKENSVLILYGKHDTPVVAIVGLNGIKPGTLYTLHDSEDRFVEATP
jgi:hypothetical protein